MRSLRKPSSACGKKPPSRTCGMSKVIAPSRDTLRVVLETVAVAAPLGDQLVRCDAQVVLAFHAHRCIHDDADQLGQGLEALCGDLFHNSAGKVKSDGW